MNHEKLECYRQLVLVAEEVARRVTRWPKGHGDLVDQLRRATTSAVLNYCCSRNRHAGAHRF